MIIPRTTGVLLFYGCYQEAVYKRRYTRNDFSVHDTPNTYDASEND